MKGIIGKGRIAALAILVVTGLVRANAAPATSASVTIVHTAGLGAILTGVRGVDAATSEALVKKLAALRATYGEAVFVDGGDAVGPLVLSDTEFGLRTYRIFDKHRYAAAALSARDGLHTFSFYRILPPYAKVATPLVGTFKHWLPPDGKFYPVQPAWATAERSGVKFQIFGVATSSRLTGIVEPLVGVQTQGDVTGQAAYVLKHLKTDCIPIVLSDLTAAENDALAKRLDRNAVLFEAGYPWRLADRSETSQRIRRVGPVLVVSHFSPGDADIVVLPRDHTCAKAQVLSETLWTPPEPPSGSTLSRLLGREPLEARLVRSWFTDSHWLPDIGIPLGARRDVPMLLKNLGLAYEEDSIERVPPLEEGTEWKPPRWMEESRFLRGNEIVYRYDLYFNKRFVARVYHVRHVLVPNFTVCDFLAAVDQDHRLLRVRFMSPVMITHRGVAIDPLLARLAGKKSSAIRLADWPERAGAEFVVDNVVRSLQMLLAWDEEAD